MAPTITPRTAGMARPVAARLPARRLSLRVQASSTDAASPSAAPSHLVANLLVQKEEELKQMITPGRLAPRAATIAGLRKEIAALRAQLKSAVAANLPPTLAADLPAPPALEPNVASVTRSVSYAASSATATATPAAAPGGGSGQRSPIAAREALLLVEQHLSVAGGSGAAISGADILAARGRSALQAVEQSLSMGVVAAAATEELAEFEALQQENVLLKSRLEALLERQRLLTVVKERLDSGKAAGGAADGEAPAPAPKRRGRKPAAPKPEGEEGAEKKPRARRTTKKGAEAAAASAPTPRRRAAPKKDAEAALQGAAA